jgi:hypothetical protein
MILLRLVNVNNRAALNSLAAKGLLHDTQGSIDIIKSSFKYYISSALKPDEEESRYKEISKKGR